MPGSSKPAGKTPGLPQGKVRGSNQGGGPTEIMGMGGPTVGSNVAGVNMVNVGGPNQGSTYPNGKTQGLPQGKVKGSSIQSHVPGNYGKIPKGSTVAAGKIAKFHATRGASKL